MSSNSNCRSWLAEESKKLYSYSIHLEWSQGGSLSGTEKPLTQCFMKARWMQQVSGQGASTLAGYRTTYDLDLRKTKKRVRVSWTEKISSNASSLEQTIVGLSDAHTFFGPDSRDHGVWSIIRSVRVQYILLVPADPCLLSSWDTQVQRTNQHLHDSRPASSGIMPSSSHWPPAITASVDTLAAGENG